MRTQQIIGEEIGVTNTVDPLGGSYFVEWLTDELERRATRAARPGRRAVAGRWRASSSGWMQEQIQEEAYRAELATVSGEKVVVGVNRYTETEEAQAAGDLPHRRASRERAARTAARRIAQRRDDARRSTVRWSALRAAAAGDGELMPAILDAVRADATLGEICGTLRDVFGEYQPPTTI